MQKKTHTLYVVGNWKEYPESIKDAGKISGALAKKNVSKGITAVVCPPHPFLQTVGPLIKKGKYVLGAQDVSPLIIGANTGEVSPKALRSLGVEYVIVGHSERRAMGETNELIVQKIRAAIASGIRPILCIGEKGHSTAERSHAEIFEQLSILNDLTVRDAASLLIAYEPLWAIGAKAAASPEDAREMRIYIQKVLADTLGQKVLSSVPILYGGSVTPKNAKEFITTAGMQGLLVGRASLDPKSFIQIIDSLK